MIRYIFATGMMSVFAMASAALPSYDPADVKIDDVQVRRDGTQMLVSCGIDASALRLKSNQEVSIEPFIASGNDTLRLAPVTVAGRNRYIFHIRNNDLDSRSNGLYHNGKGASSIEYVASTTYSDWMDSSSLGYVINWSGCCSAPVMSETAHLADVEMGDNMLAEQLLFVEPKATGEKMRHVDGRAFIDFPVNKTVINADYRSNAVELAKIAKTIDNVRGDKDVTITSIKITGYASPEGSYAVNERLAKGRTEALVEYVHDIYDFTQSVRFMSEWVAEDWDGLKAWLSTSDMAGRERIINIIESDLQPDQKEAKIRSDYPADYSWLLANVFPMLRHSDYVIEYVIREYTDPTEIVEVMRKDPSKLSLSELYFAAQAAGAGTELFNEIFETAARLHPTDEMANLNAANASLSRGDTTAAASYLEKAGNSPEALYSKAMMMMMNNEYDEAKTLLESIKSYDKAQELLNSFDDLKRASQGYGKVTR